MIKFKSLEEKIDFEKNTGKNARFKRYKNLVCNSSLELPLTESDIDTWAFNRVCVESGCSPKLFKSELLGNSDNYWESLKNYEN